MAITNRRIDDAFATYVVEPSEALDIQFMREAFTELLDKVMLRIPDRNGRYRALVTTKLEEACMLTIKGIVRK